ncbi:hypothetical protein ABPG72_009603 [Tetrahymena utriculariae]
MQQGGTLYFYNKILQDKHYNRFSLFKVSSVQFCKMNKKHFQCLYYNNLKNKGKGCFQDTHIHVLQGKQYIYFNRFLFNKIQDHILYKQCFQNLNQNNQQNMGQDQYQVINKNILQDKQYNFFNQFKFSSNLFNIFSISKNQIQKKKYLEDSFDIYHHQRGINLEHKNKVLLLNLGNFYQVGKQCTIIFQNHSIFYLSNTNQSFIIFCPLNNQLNECINQIQIINQFIKFVFIITTSKNSPTKESH